MAGSSNKWRRRVFVGLACAVIGGPLLGLGLVTAMPGSSYDGEPPDSDDGGGPASARMRAHTEMLAAEIVERDMTHPEALKRSEDYILDVWKQQGFEPTRRPYEVDGTTVHNLEVEIPGSSRPEEIVVVGAHYDSALGMPGADDNASGTAAVLELSRRFVNRPLARTLRLVAFVNEEPPHFQADTMGSLVYARESRARDENIVGMLSLETIGYYIDEPGSQHYPPVFSALYPDRGDFIAFVGHLESRAFVRRSLGIFREHARIPSEGAAAPSAIPGIGWSDHWSFSREGYPAVMVTDTAPFRNPNYHEPTDTPETLDYERMALVVEGLEAVIVELGSADD